MRAILFLILVVIGAAYVFGGGLSESASGDVQTWFVEGVVTNVVDEYRCYPDPAYASGEVCGMVTTVYLRESGKLLPQKYVVKNHWENPIDMTRPQCRFKVIKTPYGDNGIIALGCSEIGGSLPANWLQN